MIRAITCLYIALIFLLMFLMAFMLPLDGYIDYVWYNTCLTQGRPEDSEPGFGLICNITSFFPDNVAVKIPRILSLFLLILSVIIFSKNFDIFTGLFFLYINGFQTLGAYRQGTATIFLSFALLFVLKNKYKAYNFSNVFAFLFHYTSILPILAVWFRKYINFWIAIILCFGILLIELVLSSNYASLLIPESVLYRYINLTNESLPGSSYFAFGKLWYIFYYSYFILISYNYFLVKDFNNYFSEIKKLYFAFLPIIIAVPTLTLLDSWAATRVSSMTNAFEIVFFALCATNFQRMIMFLAYFVRTSIASLNFFVF